MSAKTNRYKSSWGRRAESRRGGPTTPRRPRAPWGRFQNPCAPALRPRPRLDPALLARADWPGWWQAASGQLRAAGLRTGTLRVYRQVLRSFRDFLQSRGAGARPGCATPRLAREFLYRLSDRHASASWTASHISALRTVFDKLAGTALTQDIPTPKRPRRLHDVLGPDEVGRMLQAAASARDRLAILLLYGCGLKTSELCALRWEDVDLPAGTVRVRFAGRLPCSDAQHLLQGERQLPLARIVIPLLQAESVFQAKDAAFLFPGRRADRPLSARTVERVVRAAARKAGLAKAVCCMTLRRSYAVQCLRDGMEVSRVQQNLGHRHIESTLLFRRYLLPEERVTISGASRLPFPDVPLAAAAPMSAQPCGP